MEHRIPGNYYLVELIPGWNEANYTIAKYSEENGSKWTGVCLDDKLNCTSYVKSYKALSKVGKMHPFAVLSIKK
jgi:hypothetical protein